MKFKEIEFKYNAENIALTAFTKFCRDRSHKKYIEASGYDHFYAKPAEEGAFCRHRIGPEFNQLTFKRKTTDKNSFVRTELNLDLAMTARRDEVEALCGELGCEYNMSLFKSCFIYKYDWYTFVYYIVYNTDLKELGRFIEIEMSEDHDWANEQQAWNELLILEKLCKPLGVTPQSRIKRSLFELYKK